MLWCGHWQFTLIAWNSCNTQRVVSLCPRENSRCTALVIVRLLVSMSFISNLIPFRAFLWRGWRPWYNPRATPINCGYTARSSLRLWSIVFKAFIALVKPNCAGQANVVKKPKAYALYMTNALPVTRQLIYIHPQTGLIVKTCFRDATTLRHSIVLCMLWLRSYMWRVGEE